MYQMATKKHKVQKTLRQGVQSLAMPITSHRQTSIEKPKIVYFHRTVLVNGGKDIAEEPLSLALQRRQMFTFRPLLKCLFSMAEATNEMGVSKRLTKS